MSDVLEKDAISSGTAVTLTTTSETEIINSPIVKFPFNTGKCVIKAFAQLTTGTATTTVTARIRRGTGVAGTLVGEANAITIGAAAGSNEQFYIMVVEERADVSEVQYTLTLQQASATGNGTLLQAAIDVEVLQG